MNGAQIEGEAGDKLCEPLDRLIILCLLSAE